MFITGRNSELGLLLTRKLLEQDVSVISTELPDSTPLMDGDGKPYTRYRGITWNSRSLLSARNVLLEVINTRDGMDTGIIVLPTTADNRPFHDLPASEIDVAIDSNIKSQFFLVKEILAYFQKRERGKLAFILYKGGTDALPPLDAAVYGCMRDFINSLFVFYQNERVLLQGFESNTPYPEEFAEFIVQAIKEKNEKGRWYRHSMRPSLLENLPFSLKRKS